MAELARGSVADRPWGRTFATLGLRALTGQLSLVADGKRFVVAFDQGAVVAAASPLTADAAVRVALTSHLVSSSQVPEIARRLASAPDRDEVDVIAELARLGPDHALRLRRRVIAQRAARTFAINQGEFVVPADTELAVLDGCELDVRAVVYMGARANLSEQRLSDELELLGAWFRLKPGLDDDLPQFGFTDLEQPVIERLRDGGTLAEIEAFATSFVDGRTVRAVIYALAACSACELEPAAGQPRARIPTPTSSRPGTSPPGEPPRTMTQPLQRVASPPPAPVQPPHQRTGTLPMPRLGTPGAAPPDASRPQRPTPGGRPKVTPPTIQAQPTPPSELVPSKTTMRVATVPPPPRPPLGTGTAARPAEVFDAPTWRDADEEARPLEDRPRRLGSEPGRDSSSGSLRVPPVESRPGASERPRRPSSEAGWRDSSSGSLRVPPAESGPGAGDRPQRPGSEAGRRDGSSGSLRVPPVESGPGAGERPRRPSDEATRRGSSGSQRIPIQDAGTSARDRARRSTAGSSGAIRLPSEEALGRDSASGAYRLSADGGSSGVYRLPGDDVGRDGASGTYRLPGDSARRAGDEGRRRQSSSPGLHRPLEPEAGPGLVVRRATASRPQPVRQVQRVDTPQSHDVKALIAQRLKLLDQGADHFQLLGVAQDVPADALRKAYFALARQLHPDRLAALGISDDGRHAQRLFAQINAGFAILSDHGRRARYLDILRRGGEAAIRAEQARAEEMARRILEAEEAVRRGEIALRRDQPGAAIAELERAVQLNPDETDYHASLAWSRFCAAPDKPAVAVATRAALERAIQSAPRAVTARFYLGRVERMLGRDQDALRHFRDVLTASPGHAEAASEVRVLEARLPGGGGPGRPKR